MDAAFKAQPEEPIGWAPRGLAAVLCEDRGCGLTFHGGNAKARFIHFTVRRQMRVVRSTFGAESNGLVDIIEQMLLLQRILHHCHCGAAQALERMIDFLEGGSMYPPFDICVHAGTEYDVIAAIDVCEPAGSSLKFNLLSARDRMIYCFFFRKFIWLDIRDLLADGPIKRRNSSFVVARC